MEKEKVKGIPYGVASFEQLSIRFRVCFGRFFGPFRSCSSSDSPLSSSSQKRKSLKNSSQQIIAR